MAVESIDFGWWNSLGNVARLWKKGTVSNCLHSAGMYQVMVFPEDMREEMDQGGRDLTAVPIWSTTTWQGHWPVEPWIFHWSTPGFWESLLWLRRSVTLDLNPQFSASHSQQDIEPLLECHYEASQCSPFKVATGNYQEMVPKTQCLAETIR